MTQMTPTPQKPQPVPPANPDAVYNQAQRDVLLGLQPSLNDLANQRQLAQQDYARGNAQSQSAYRDFRGSMAPLGPQYQQQVQGIEDRFGQQIQGLSQYLSPTASPGALADAGGNPAGTTGAARNLFGTIGAGGYELLASQAERNAGYQTSALRQGSIDEQTVRRNYLQDLQDALSQLRQNRTQLMSGVPQTMLQREDQLRQQNVQNKLAFGDLALKRKTVNATLAQTSANQKLASDTVTNYQNSGKGRRKGGGGGKSGGGGGSANSASSGSPSDTGSSSDTNTGTTTGHPGRRTTPKTPKNPWTASGNNSLFTDHITQPRRRRGGGGRPTQ